MATVTPPTITALPAPPDPNNRATFNTRAYPWSVAQQTLATEVGAVATNVKANADDAATSSTTATTQAGTATTQAGNAATSAGTATTQAGTATTQAGIATTQAGNAAASAVQASKLNLGNKTSAPTLDNQGAALLAGATYYDTTLSKWRVWTGSVWSDGISAVAGVASVNGVSGAVTNIATTGANTFTTAQEWKTGAAIASAATVNLDTATGNRVHVTGTTTITAVTLTRGPRTVIFDGVLTLTHNATTNNLPSAANITTAVGDRAIYESDGTTVYCVDYIRASGLPIVAGPSGALVLLSVINASGATTVDIETGFGSTYDDYLIIASDVNGSIVTASIDAQFKQGGAYITSGCSFANWFTSAASNTFQAAGVAVGTGTVALKYVGGGNITGNVERVNIEINLYGVNSAQKKKAIFRALITDTANAMANANGFGTTGNTGVITGVRILPSSGTVSGTFKLYGIAKV